jgi:hypothetical protein
MKNLLSIIGIPLLIVACSSAPSIQSRVDELEVRLNTLSDQVDVLRETSDNTNTLSKNAVIVTEKLSDRIDTIFKKANIQQ